MGAGGRALDHLWCNVSNEVGSAVAFVAAGTSGDELLGMIEVEAFEKGAEPPSCWEV